MQCVYAASRSFTPQMTRRRLASANHHHTMVIDNATSDKCNNCATTPDGFVIDGEVCIIHIFRASKHCYSKMFQSTAYVETAYRRSAPYKRLIVECSTTNSLQFGRRSAKLPVTMLHCFISVFSGVPCVALLEHQCFTASSHCRSQPEYAWKTPPSLSSSSQCTTNIKNALYLFRFYFLWNFYSCIWIAEYVSAVQYDSHRHTSIDMQDTHV